MGKNGGVDGGGDGRISVTPSGPIPGRYGKGGAEGGACGQKQVATPTVVLAYALHMLCTNQYSYSGCVSATKVAALPPVTKQTPNWSLIASCA